MAESKSEDDRDRRILAAARRAGSGVSKTKVDALAKELGPDPRSENAAAELKAISKVRLRLHEEAILAQEPEWWEQRGDKIMAALVRQRLDKAEAKKQSEGKDWIWITWNPDPAAPFHDTLKAWQKQMSKKSSVTHCYTIEYHGASGGKHIHFHGLIEIVKDDAGKTHQDHKPSRFRDGCNNTFKGLFRPGGNTLKIEYVSDDQMEGILAYIRGSKAPEKMDAVYEDMAWREREGLDQIYPSQAFEQRYPMSDDTLPYVESEIPQ